MKKSFLTLVPALALVAMMASSCSDKCCTQDTEKVCESDLPAGFTDWDAYATTLEAGGYTCD